MYSFREQEGIHSPSIRIKLRKVIIFSLVIVLALSVSTMTSPSPHAYAVPADEPEPGLFARSAVVGSTDPTFNPGDITAGRKDIFLGGKFIETGITRFGSFGSVLNAPANFNPFRAERNTLGFRYHADGFGKLDPTTGTYIFTENETEPTSGDFFLPGTPWEGYGIGYRETESGAPVNRSNSEADGERTMFPITHMDQSDVAAGLLKALTVGSDGKIEYSQTVSFDEYDKFMQINVVLKNVSASTLYDVRYQRNVDLDIDADLQGSFVALSTVTANPPADQFAIVTSSGPVLKDANGNPLNSISLIAADRRARATIDTSNAFSAVPHAANAWQEDGSTMLKPPATAGNPIALTFKLGDLNAGEEVSLSYFYSLDPNIQETLNNIASQFPGVATNLQATAGDGQALVMFTAPPNRGAGAISKYTVIATPSDGSAEVVAEGQGTAIMVNGLTNNVSYTFKVTASNSLGTGAASEVSNSVVPRQTSVPATETVEPEPDATTSGGTTGGTSGTGGTSDTTGGTSGTGGTTGTGGATGGTASGGQPEPTSVVAKVAIVRSVNPDGTRNDNVAFSPSEAQNSTTKALEAGLETVQIKVPDKNGTQKEARVTLPSTAISALADNGMNLEIASDHGGIKIPPSSLKDLGGDVFFRITPSKPKNEQAAQAERNTIASDISKSIDGAMATVIGNPLKIETSVSKIATTISIPVDASLLPTNAAQREAFLRDLGIYIQHSDGDRVLVRPRVITGTDGSITLEVDITKFSTFSIVKVADWGANVGAGYITPSADGLFRPNDSITRADLAVMLSKVAKLKGTPAKTTFADVAQANTANIHIARVVEKGWMKLDAAGNFKPNDSLTRAELATILSGVKELATGDFSGVIDIAEDSAKEAIQKVIGAKIMGAIADKYFQPLQLATRAETVMALNKLYGIEPLVTATPSFKDVTPRHPAYREIEAATE